MYIISQGILNLKDMKVLAKEETEEMVRADILGSEMPLIYFSLNIDESTVSIIN